jgi:hypothetical protein
MYFSQILDTIFALEQAHRDAMNSYMEQLQSEKGTKDNPIGDDNYLWLKCRHTLNDDLIA